VTESIESLKEANILVVDDTPANLKMLSGMLKEQGYKARPVPSGKLALKAAESNPPDLILLDINMPEMDGYEVCRYLKENEMLRDIPIIFISALTETVDKLKAFSVGGVDYVTKPFQFEEVRARVETHLRIRHLQMELEKHNRHLEKLVKEQVKEISDSQMSTILALARLAESRDKETGQHLEHVQAYCKTLATKLSETKRFQGVIDDRYIDNIFHASPLHDIGKVGIADSILLKAGKLTKEEFNIMKEHTNIGAQTLEVVRNRYPNNKFVNMGIAVARSHHEKWDGTGYPDGLAGEDIPLCARIMAFADVYDALISERHYKDVLSYKESRDMMVVESGKYFDPLLVEIFLEIEDKFIEISENPEH
jgi:putative two-component system response regulator